MTSDPLSDMLTHLNARSVMSGGLVAGGDWAIRFPQPNRIKITSVARGACWLLREGHVPLRLDAGDVLLLNGTFSFVLATDPSLEPVDAKPIFRGRTGPIAYHGEGDDFFYIGGHVALDHNGMDLLLDVLPPIIHVRAGLAEAGTVRWLLDELIHEMASERPGGQLAASQLAHLMFVQLLRAHIAASEPMAAGWLRAIGDERIAPALRLMHADPARDWQLGELARAVGMSRTSFALRFKSIAGIAPLAYLAGWRMRLAERALRDGNMPISSLALSLGYTSESAFSNAFKRVTGVSPKRYRTVARAAGPAAEAEDETSAAA